MPGLNCINTVCPLVRIPPSCLLSPLLHWQTTFEEIKTTAKLQVWPCWLYLFIHGSASTWHLTNLAFSSWSYSETSMTQIPDDVLVNKATAFSSSHSSCLPCINWQSWLFCPSLPSLTFYGNTLAWCTEMSVMKVVFMWWDSGWFVFFYTVWIVHKSISHCSKHKVNTENWKRAIIRIITCFSDLHLLNQNW